MYGTVAHLRVRPGMEKQLLALFAEYESVEIPTGVFHTYLYQMDRDSNEYYMAVLFEDKESYIANADSPEQDTRYQKMRAILTEDPEWNDGEVVFTLQQEAAACTL